ncbi:MAG: hypothetical protein HOO06_06440 [Bdellovibrionaceae bacterium]|nr:hypothetical protein [Pseudobdellovibrionaceae bacterium]
MIRIIFVGILFGSLFMTGCKLTDNAIVGDSPLSSIVDEAPEETAPGGSVALTGLSNDLVWKTSKVWNWGCDQSTCTYQYVIDTNPATDPSGLYVSDVTATQNTGAGTFYLHIRAKDQDGSLSDTVHVSALVDQVLSVAPSGLVDGASLNSLTTTNTVTWTGASDAHSGLDHYEIAIGNTTGASDVLNWKNIGNVLSHQESGLSLSSGNTYYVSVRAVDVLGNISSVAQGDGWVADNSVPTLTGLSNDAVWTKSKTWNWGCSAASCTYQYVIDTTSNTTPGTSYTSAITATQNSGTGAYYLHIRALNSLGTYSNVYHYSVNIDNTAPGIVGSLVDGTSYNSITATDTITWTLATDVGGGLDHYELAIGNTAGATDVLDWKNISNVLSRQETGLSLTNTNTYYASIRAVDAAGNIGSVVQGDGWTANYVVINCTNSPTKDSTVLFSDGKGSAKKPYLICNIDQLQKMNENLSGFYELGKNIDATATSGWSTGTSGTGFIPIGHCFDGYAYQCADYNSYAYNGDNGFTGSFDGNGYTVDQLFINRSRDTVGLFGLVNSQAVIMDFNLSNVNITGVEAGYHYIGGAGGAIGFAQNSFIKNIFTSGTVDGELATGGVVGRMQRAQAHSLSSTSTSTGSDGDVGGAVGFLDRSALLNSNTSGVVGGSAGTIGGLVGKLQLSRMYDSQSTTAVTGAGAVGGAVGKLPYEYDMNLSWSRIKRVSVNSNVVGTSSGVGGLVGLVDTYGHVDISDSFSQGTVSGVGKVGGLIGEFSGYNSYIYQGTVKNSFSTSTVDGGGGLAGGLIGSVYGDYYTAVDNTFAANSVTNVSAVVGGLVGERLGNGTFSNNHWYKSGGVAVDCYDGGNANCSQEMTLSNLYSATHAVYTGTGAWDFSNIWKELGASLPRFMLVSDIALPFAGTGTMADPYLITTFTEWNFIADQRPLMSKVFKIANNIDFSGQSLIPVGSVTVPFSGTLLGNAMTISNVLYDGAAGPGALVLKGDSTVIKNLIISNFTITGAGNSAMLVGLCEFCLFSNIQITGGSVVSTGSGVGAIVGNGIGINIYNSISSANVTGLSGIGGLVGTAGNFASDITGVKIVSSSSSGAVSGTYSIGGLVGAVEGVIIEQSFATGNVIASALRAGGLIGYIVGGGWVKNSYATGDVLSTGHIGGLVGSIVTALSDDLQIRNSYSTGNVDASGGERVGGFLGEGGRAYVYNSYCTGTISNYGTGSGLFIGRIQNATLSNVFWHKPSGALTSCYFSGDLNCTEEPVITNFYDKTHTVYTTGTAWDFDDLWLEDGGQLTYPLLR